MVRAFACHVIGPLSPATCRLTASLRPGSVAGAGLVTYGRRTASLQTDSPGATVTPINRAWVDDPEKSAQVVTHIPMGRAGTSEEMAAVTVFLCSEEAAYVTGQTIFVDGGLTLYPDFRTAWSSE